MITLDAGQLARGWLACYQATGRDEHRPALTKTLHIDQYEQLGVRLSCTDSYMLLTCWIPAQFCDTEPEPSLDEVPYGSATIIDRHNRAVSLLTYLLTLTKDDDHKGLQVNVSLNVPWQPDDLDPADRQIDGFEAHAVVLEAPDRERLQLEVYEGAYPGWQRIVARQRNTRTDHIALNPDVTKRLARAAALADAGTVKHWFGGRDKPIQVEFGDNPAVTGLIMPTQWNFDTDSPWGAGTSDGGE